MPLLMSIVNGIFGLTLVFICCELGQRMSDAFDKTNFTLVQLDWYLFPIEMKRMLPAIIAMIQRPVSMECFGSIICTRDVFKNVGIQRSTKNELKNDIKISRSCDIVPFLFRLFIVRCRILWCFVD